jgi:hypothetical protein
MFMTAGAAFIFIAVNFLVGAMIGIAVVVALLWRSRVRFLGVILAAFLAGTAFVLTSGLAGWASAHAAFQNGQRMDTAPWGEDLRLRNLIAENEILLCVSSSALAGILVGVCFRYIVRTDHLASSAR